mmetsp:Transcript_7283/g.6430  ORF Transcript_7283/g.6430 Transcript_7283/m.6430 type:complete len:102 (+) Transcript_7283:2444-2749(+)
MVRGNSQSHFQSKIDPLVIEINMKNTLSKQKKDSSGKHFIEIRDNGPGIHPKQMMDALTSFGGPTLPFKSDYNFSEHGIGLKLNSMRLGSTLLIISKTQPV